MPDVQEAVGRARAVLTDSTKGLTFNVEEHRYFLYGRELKSVSSIVEGFNPFDMWATAMRCSLNPRHEHYGKPAEEIMALWKEEGRKAADEGTKVHAFGEACCLYMFGRENEIEPEFQERITSEGLAAVTHKEEAAARWWNDNDWNRFAVVAKETRIANPALGYAGTFDLLLYDRLDREYEVDDYKSNKDLERWYGDYLRAPLSMIRANNLGEYTVQQTLYTIELRNIGLAVMRNNLIWLSEDGYRIYDLPTEYDRVITYAVSNLKNQ